MKLFGNKKTEKKKPASGIRTVSGAAEGPVTPGRGPAAGDKRKASDAQKRKKALRRGLTVLGVIVLVVAAVIVGYSIWEKPPETANNRKPGSASVSPKPSAGVADPSVTDGPDENDPDVDPFEGALDTDRDDGIYTFLLVGRDHESNSTDTILVGRLDTGKHTIDCINIPRDTMANISWADTPKKINAVYPGYYNSGRDAVEGLKTHVKNLIGFEVDCYAVVNLNVVEDVINEIGGVYFDVPMDMDYDDGSQHFHVHLKAGYQLLNGYETLGVFRYRYGNNGKGSYPGGDMERIGVQQSLLKAIASQMLSLGNIPNLGNVIQLCLDNVETDLDASNMAFFARQFLMCSADNINFHTAPIGASATINNISYVSLNVSEWLKMVNECVNPYKDPVTAANVSILTTNSSGTVFDSTTGAVAGGLESFACNEPGCELRFSHHASGAHVYAGEGEPGGETGGEEQGGTSGEIVDIGQEPGGETGGESGGEPFVEPEPAPVETPPPGVAGDAPVEITFPLEVG